MFIFALRKLVLFDIFWLATKAFFATEWFDWAHHLGTEGTEANFSLHRIKNKVGFSGRGGTGLFYPHLQPYSERAGAVG
jgi:hypothetical protein